MSDDQKDDGELMPDNEFREALGNLLDDLASRVQNAKPDQEETPNIRTFPPDTRMGDLPKDMTAEESLALFGSEYDESTAKLKTMVEMLLGPNAFHMIAAHKVREVCDPVFRINDDDRLFEVVPKGLLIDVVTIGMLAHEILKHVMPADGGPPQGISVQAFSLNDLLNGQGPFPIDPKNRDDDDS